MVTPPLTRAPRRWPALASGFTAAVLVLLVLPNPLKVPQQNPTATAEYAPVPGNSDDAAENANFGETGLAGSAGIGAGGNGAGNLPGIFKPPPPQFRPRQKLCVGNPPRQTEDPLSPPCVPFFDGDNGGETYRGVTAKAIEVVLYNDLGVDGDMNEAWEPNQETTGASAQPYAYVNLVRTIKAQLRYFQGRYQTYGRTVHVRALPASGGLSSSCPQREGDALVTRQDYNPFATVHLGDNGQCYMAKLAHDLKVPSFGLNSDVKRSVYEGSKPYIWGFFPDQEEEAQWSASFLCRTLKGHNAEFAKDPELKPLERKFGLIIPQVGMTRGPEMRELGELLIKYSRQICGLDLTTHMFEYKASGTGPAGARESANIMTDFKTKKVTTVICYCVAVATEVTVSTMQNQARSLNYFPEWYWDHASRMFRAIWERQYGDQQVSNFGISHHWRQPEYHSQQHYKAYAQAETGSEPNAFFNFDLYHLFLNLFESIQAAGPHLTPETVQQGMYTFNYTSAKNPFVPTGGYGPYNGHAVADLNFVDTAMAWWWDPRGRADGETEDGCLRLMNRGQRYYWDQWPTNDDAMYNTTNGMGPCSPDDRKLLEGGAAGA
jgi:hypothetical protein